MRVFAIVWAFLFFATSRKISFDPWTTARYCFWNVPNILALVSAMFRKNWVKYNEKLAPKNEHSLPLKIFWSWGTNQYYLLYYSLIQFSNRLHQVSSLNIFLLSIYLAWICLLSCRKCNAFYLSLFNLDTIQM